MTNAEKFKDVFGFKPEIDICPVDTKYCESHKYKCENCEYRTHDNNWWEKTYKKPVRRQDVDWNIRADYITDLAKDKNVAPIYAVYTYYPEWLEVLVPTKTGGVQINYGALEQWLEGGEYE